MRVSNSNDVEFHSMRDNLGLSVTSSIGVSLRVMACQANVSVRIIKLTPIDNTYLSVVRGCPKKVSPDAIDLAVVLGDAHFADPPILHPRRASR